MASAIWITIFVSIARFEIFLKATQNHKSVCIPLKILQKRMRLRCSPWRINSLPPPISLSKNSGNLKQLVMQSQQRRINAWAKEWVSAWDTDRSCSIYGAKSSSEEILYHYKDPSCRLAVRFTCAPSYNIFSVFNYSPPITPFTLQNLCTIS